MTDDAYKFYEYMGYRLVMEEFIGRDNAKWHGDPVPIRIVSREQSSLCSGHTARTNGILTENSIDVEGTAAGHL